MSVVEREEPDPRKGVYMQSLEKMSELLVCPATGEPLEPVPLPEARGKSGGPLSALRETHDGDPSPPFGATEQVLFRKDLRAAYPVVDRVPILLAPEVLGPEGEVRSFDLSDPKYAEAYQEMKFYNETSSREAEDILNSESYEIVEPATRATRAMISSFPEPRGVWLDAVYDCAAQWDAYSHIAPVRGKRVLQLGGKGAHAVKFLLAGASEAWAVTPMLGEARGAMALAEAVGVADRLRCVVAIAEELPFATGTFDAVYSGGCLHHTVTTVAVPEAERVLKEGGKFAAIDPWRAPLYGVGTKIMGKREPDVFCRPLNDERVEPVRGGFGVSAVVQHGALTRYPLLALNKFGLTSPLSAVWSLNKIDDGICSLVGLRRTGSSVVCLGTKWGNES